MQDMFGNEINVSDDQYNKDIKTMADQAHQIAVLEKTLQLLGREVLFFGDCGHDDLVNKFINEFKQQAEKELKDERD